MGILFYLGYKTADGGGPQSPVDSLNVAWPYDYWASLLPKLAAAGITVPVIPPPCKGASMGAGFDPFDHYDIGSKNQSGRVQTRYGSAEQLRRFAAIAARNGMECAINLVQAQLDGDSGDWVFEYLGSDGKTKNGRFPKDINCFWVPSAKEPQNPDTVPDPQWDILFGRQPRWLSGTYGDGQGGNGPGYMGRGLIAATEWLLKTVGARQIFWDDLKGTSANYIAWATNTFWLSGLINFAFGEYFDGNRNTLNNYVNTYPIMGTTGVLDFSQRFANSNWCNSPGSYDMRQLLGNGFEQIDSPKAVTFTDDADTAISEPQWRVLQSMAAIMTMTGYPMAFGQYMYDKEHGGYGLEADFLNLCWVNAKCSQGPMVWRAYDYNYVVYERPQAPGMLVGLGNKVGKWENPADWTPVTVETAWWPGTVIHDITGHSNDQTVGVNGSVTIWVPPVDVGGPMDGRAYVIFTQKSVTGSIFVAEHSATQHFYGAADLDIGPATEQGTPVSQWIWCDENKPIDLKAIAGDGVQYMVTDPEGKVIVPKGGWYGETKVAGKHVVTAYSPTATPVPFEVQITYWATADLTDDEIEDEIPPVKASADPPIPVDAHDLVWASDDPPPGDF